MADNYTFSTYFHHGGNFVSLGNGKEYVGGQIHIKSGLDADRFGYLDLEDEVKKLGYISWESLWFKVPKEDSYNLIRDDKEVLEMTSNVCKNSRIFRVFVVHGKMKENNDDKDVSKEPEMVDKWLDVAELESDAADDEFAASEEGESTSDDDEFSDAKEDDYLPVGESETEDDLSDFELKSDDEEYIEARQNKKNPPSVAAVEVYSELRGNERRQEHKTMTYDPKCDHKSLKLALGMKFMDGFQCKHAIQTISIYHGHPIRFTRFNKRQCEAKCIPECGWRCYGSIVKIDQSFVIKRLTGEHKCPREMNNKQATSSWIANEYLYVFRERPNITRLELLSDMMRRFACEVGKWKLYRAKWKALEKIRGSLSDHYERVRSYILELMRVDKEGRFELLLGDKGVFKALYFGFSALKKGFLGGCRPIIGLDGCFLKTALGGVLLCATSKDGNNQMYPIAWAAVEVENHACWTWFLNILFDELGIEKTQAASTNTKNSQSKSAKMKEIAHVKTGYGVRSFEGSGNIYMRMPTDKKVYLVNSQIASASGSRGRGRPRKSSGRGVGSGDAAEERGIGRETQESHA